MGSMVCPYALLNAHQRPSLAVLAPFKTQRVEAAASAAVFRAGKPMPKPQCTVCKHPELAVIERSRVLGISAKALSQKYGVSEDSIFRHFKRHVSPEKRASYIADAPLHELATKAAEQGVSLMDHLGIVRSRLMRLFLLATDMNDKNTAVNISRALLECLRDAGRLSGELLSVSQVNVTNNYAVLMQSPAFAQLQQMLVEALADEPAALRKVIAGLDRLEAEADGDNPKLIEHKP
jgi:hypothetical protein